MNMKVIFEGVDLYPDISVNACFHDMYAEKRADSLLLRFNDTRRLWDGWSPAQENTIRVECGTAGTGKLFVRSIVPENGLYTLRAYATPQTESDPHNKSWERVRLLQLAREIAERQSLAFASYGVTDRLYDYVRQENMPDFTFLQERCLLEGCAFLVYDGTLVLYDEPYMESMAASETLTATTDSDFAYTDDSLRAFGRAELVNGAYTGVFDAGNGLSKKLRRVMALQIGSQTEANRFARNLLRDANNGMRGGTLWTAFKQGYAAASVADLKTTGASSWDGRVFVTHIRHDYAHGKTKLFFRKPLEGY